MSGHEKAPMVQLGKLPKVEDERTLKLSNYVDPAKALEVVHPLKLDLVVKDWPMYGNDRIGDCGPAATGHYVLGTTAAVAKAEGVAPPAPPTLDDVIRFYSLVSGYDPRTGANDNGVVVLDMLKLWRTVGIGGHKIGAFAEVNLKDRRLADWASSAFGGLILGYDLPVAVQPHSDGVIPEWTGAPLGALTGKWEPGSWGGHCVNEVHNNLRGWRKVASWEHLLRVDTGFEEGYRDEAWVVISPDWFDDHSLAPSGLNMAQLEVDLSRVT